MYGTTGHPNSISPIALISDFYSRASGMFEIYYVLHIVFTISLEQVEILITLVHLPASHLNIFQRSLASETVTAIIKGCNFS